MNIKRILCPIDFSNFNHAANEYASMLAESTGARLIYLHAYLLDPYETPPIYFDAEKKEKELIKKMEGFVEPVSNDPNGTGVECSYVLEYGLATERIVHFAKENEIDLIVLGTHGRTGIKRILMGSVAESVVRHADCPVLAIKAEANVPVEV